MGINNDVEQRRIEERPDWSLASACEGRTCIQNPKKNRYTERVFSMLPQIDFPDPLRYFRSVLGRGAGPISSRACFSDQLRTPVRKGTLVDPPKSLGELNTQAVGGQA